MRKLIILLLPLFLFACKNHLSKSDKDLLTFKIQLHNSQTSLKWRLDSIDRDTELKIEILRKSFLKKDAEIYLKSSMALFESKWNRPYDIKRDMLLTLPKYLEYCKAYNYDVKTYIDFVDK